MKKLVNIRINDKLAEILEDVPKSTSYANWILDKLERLDAHELNPVCWIVSESNVSSNRMAAGDENGESPLFDEILYIVSECPQTNMSGEDRDEGWLGQNGDSSAYAHGGFASIEAAKTYITQYMNGRLIPTEFLDENIYENDDVYTTAKFDQYYMVDDFMSIDEPEVVGLTDEEIEKLAEQLEKEANDEGYGICGDIEEYLIELRDSKNK